MVQLGGNSRNLRFEDFTANVIFQIQRDDRDCSLENNMLFQRIDVRVISPIWPPLNHKSRHINI